MKKICRSYFVFTSLLYRIFGLVVLPAGIPVLMELVYRTGEEYFKEALFFGYIVVFEVFADYWLFGGVCEKGMHGLEYMKTSRNGEAVLKQALTGDCLRRGIYLLIVFGMLLIQSGNLWYAMGGCITDLVIMGLLAVTRHYSYSLMTQLAFGMLAGIAFAWIVMGMKFVFVYADTGIQIAVTAVTGIVTVGVNVGIVTHITGCLKRSYYETGIK